MDQVRIAHSPGFSSKISSSVRRRSTGSRFRTLFSCAVSLMALTHPWRCSVSVAGEPFLCDPCEHTRKSCYSQHPIALSLRTRQLAISRGQNYVSEEYGTLMRPDVLCYACHCLETARRLHRWRICLARREGNHPTSRKDTSYARCEAARHGD